MLAIATVCLHAFFEIQEVCQAIVEYGDVILLARCIWAFDPHQMASPDANTKLILQC
jgi:hypothetical protein